MYLSDFFLEKVETMEKGWFEKLTDEQKAKLRGMEGDTEKLIAF